MNTSALGAALGALALAGVAVLYLKVDELSDEVRGLGRRPVFDARGGGSAAEDDDGRIRVDPAARVAARPGEAARTPADGTHAAEGTQAKPATLEERIARLERVEEQRKSHGGLPMPPGRALRMMNPISSVDELAKTLRLTPTQKDRVADAVARGRQRIEDVLKIPDETGKSPFERRKEQRAKLKEAIANNNGGGILALSTGLFADRGKKIPGRNTTYGQEIDRIKQETRHEIAQSLAPEQKKQFDDTNVDPMLGGGGGTVAMTVWSSDGPADDADDSDGRVLVGGLGVEIEPEEDAAPAGVDDGD